MTLQEHGIEFVWKDFTKNTFINLFVALGLCYILGKGTDPTSDIAARGRLIADKKQHYAKIDTSKGEEEREGIGFYLNNYYFKMGSTRLYSYDGELEKLVMEYKLNKNIKDLSLKVDGNKIYISTTAEGRLLTGRSIFYDVTKAGRYNLLFNVVYNDNTSENVRILIKKNEQKN